MRHHPAGIALALIASTAIASCTDGPSQPASLRPAAASFDVVSGPKVVISQVYGGGGNSGATYKNDFIELYNAGGTAQSLTGWSVQYASAGGTTTWQATSLSGSIAPGAYYLVQEAVGAGGTTSLPTPNATGTIAMSATAGKVALVSSTTALTSTATGCPLPAANVVDLVGYGTGSGGANCFEGTAAAPTLTNTTADLRKSNGAQDTDNNSADFATGAPNPRNSVAVVGGLDHVDVTGASSVNVNGTVTLTATLRDATNAIITDAAATYNWSSLNTAVAQVMSTSGNTATIKGVGTGSTTISVSATSNAVTKGGSADLLVKLGNVTVSARTVPLPVGFQTQLFASGTDNSGNPVGAVTWSTSDANVVAVDQHGVISAKGVGSALITATAADGSPGTTTITTESQLFSAGARSGHNLEFGTPTDHNPSDDIIVARKEYTLSYNATRGGPNWVSWDLSSTHLGSVDRCNCFTADTALTRLGFPAYDTNDYITGGLFDRGHMEPSADQTTTDTENGTTFFLSNILPQKHDLNAGPWEKLEIALRDSVRAGREVYQIAGGIFTGGVGLGSLNNLGKIFIPDSTWKIAVLMPAGKGLADVTSPADVDVIAVNMPNADGISGNGWEQYTTTVQKLQQSTGYDFLAALPEAIQCRVEVRNCKPIARITSAISPSWQTNEGQTVSFSAATSSDPDPTDVLSYRWTVDGVVAGTQQTLDYTFAKYGTYNLRLIVTDNHGAADTALVVVTALNVAPVVAPFDNATILRGETYVADGSFSDPGNDGWTATVNYGEGGTQALTLTGKTFHLSHAYATAGTFTVTVSVNDGLATGTRTATVIVKSAAQGVSDLGDMIAALRQFDAGEVNSLRAKLDAASAQLAANHTRPAANLLDAFINEIQAQVRSGRLTDAQAAPIIAYAQRVIASM